MVEIVVEHLYKIFKIGQSKIHALTDINFEIETGEFVVIYGHSGSGKTTLLNTLIGIEKPTEGTVCISGKILSNFSEDQMAQFRASKIGVIHQSQHWVKSLNVAENVSLSLLAKGVKYEESIEKSKKMLKQLRIERYLKQKPTELSGGQQQKLALASTLVSDPHIIFADEPTGNLDTENSNELIKLLQDINKNLKRTIILITHNESFFDIGTRKIEMKDGRIIIDSKK